jgi:carbonic anhydrase/acetyltransferase-like protein (isoleucine patch superfamily)
MTIFNLDKHHLTTSETMSVGANASVIRRARLGDGVSVWPGAVTRGSASALSAASTSNRLRFARAEP